MLQLTVETINGPVKVGDLIAYPGEKGMVRGKIVKIVQTSQDGYYGAANTIRVYVKRTDNTSWHPIVIIRRPASLVRIIED